MEFLNKLQCCLIDLWNAFVNTYSLVFKSNLNWRSTIRMVQVQTSNIRNQIYLRNSEKLSQIESNVAKCSLKILIKISKFWDNFSKSNYICLECMDLDYTEEFTAKLTKRKEIK